MGQKPPGIARFTHMKARKCGELRVSAAHLPARLPAFKFSKFSI